VGFVRRKQHDRDEAANRQQRAGARLGKVTTCSFASVPFVEHFAASRTGLPDPRESRTVVSFCRKPIVRTATCSPSGAST
jgi:hypothetical protein